MIIFALSLLLFIDSLSFGLVVPVFAPLFMQSHSVLFDPNTSIKVRSFLYAITLAAPPLSMIFGCPLLGALSDNYGRKRILIIGLCGVVASYSLAIIGIMVGSAIILLMSRILIGVMDGSEAVAQAAIADLSTPANKVRNMSCITLAMTMGFIVGPIVGGLLADPHLVSWFNYQVPFYAAIIVSLLNIMMMQIVFKETLKISNRRQFHYLKLLKNVFAAACDIRVRYIAISYLCMEFCFAIFFQASSLYLANRYHFSASEVGYFMTYLGVIFSLVILVLINLCLRYFNKHKIVIAGLFFIALGNFIIALAPQHLIWLIIAVIPNAAGVGMSYNIMLSLFSDSVNENEQGWIMGGITALIALSWLIAAIVIGLLSYYYHILFAIVGTVAVVGVYSFFMQGKKPVISVNEVAIND